MSHVNGRLLCLLPLRLEVVVSCRLHRRTVTLDKSHTELIKVAKPIDLRPTLKLAPRRAAACLSRHCSVAAIALPLAPTPRFRRWREPSTCASRGLRTFWTRRRVLL